MEEVIIRTQALRKSYGEFEALRGISLEVPAGSIYGFVGPNALVRPPPCVF